MTFHLSGTSKSKTIEDVLVQSQKRKLQKLSIGEIP